MADVSRSASGTAHGNTIKVVMVKIMFQVFPGVKGTNAQRGIAGVPFTFTADMGAGMTTISGTTLKTAADGSLTILTLANTPAILKIFDTEYEISALGAIEPKTTKKGVQSRLSLLGYELGDIDGNLGAKSDRSLLNYQADSHLNADGRIDNFTRDELVKDFGE